MFKPSFKCCHAVMFSLSGVRALCLINQSNLNIFQKTFTITLQKVALKKLLLNIFLITILSFSCFHFKIVPATSKTISSLTRILVTACSTAEDVDQALIIAIFWNFF